MEPWNNQDPIPVYRATPVGVILGLLRIVPLAFVVFGGLAVLLLIRVVERPIWGIHRPITPRITRTVCRLAFVILGIEYRTVGAPMTGRGAVVSNHTSWLDIFALNANDLIYFVAKSEVEGWPGIGWLARATGTLFIRRNPREAPVHRDMFTERLMAGHRLQFFPEGTSTDGIRVLPFKPTLFAAFFAPDVRDELSIQPVTLRYIAPVGQDPRYYGWWGEMEFAPNLWQILTTRPQGGITLFYHTPIALKDAKDRKTLAKEIEAAVRSGLDDQDIVATSIESRAAGSS